jgi:AcrR family transcriptional regulator
VSTRLPAEQRRRQLLDCACEAFATGGFHATSMDDIATVAGVTKPVLYQHFPSKRALFVELLDDIGARLLGEFGAAVAAAATRRARVEAGFKAYYRFVMANGAAFRLIFGASVRNDPDFAEVAERVLHEAAEGVSAQIEIDGSQEHRQLLAHALVGIAEATSRHVLNDPEAPQDPELLARWASELAWFGLRGVRVDNEISLLDSEVPERT